MLLAKEQNAVIACSNPAALRQKAYNYGITGIEFVGYDKLFNGYFEEDEKVMIDEIENFVANYIDGKLCGYTLSNED